MSLTGIKKSVGGLTFVWGGVGGDGDLSSDVE